jgi:hypothetical protein
LGKKSRPGLQLTGGGNMTDNTSDRQNTVDFLIAEYTQISEETRRLRAEGLNRLNFFIAITSAILVALVSLAQSNPTAGILLQIAAISAIFLLVLVGIETFRVSISRDINTDFNMRATGRIRRYFADRDSNLEKYLTWQDSDEPTKWVTRNDSGIRRTIQSILSFLCALIVGLIANLVSNTSTVSFSLGTGGFLLSLLFFQRYASRRFKQASEIAAKAVRFPPAHQKQRQKW